MHKIQEALQWLEDNNIDYALYEHPAVYTISEMDALRLGEHGHICKNLFLRDNKGKRHFLVTMRGDRPLDLALLEEALGVRLSFASEERLEQYLNLAKGAVTPLGVLYDTAGAVEVILDQSLEQEKLVGVHPCENIATVFLKFTDLERLLRQNGNAVTVMAL